MLLWNLEQECRLHAALRPHESRTPTPCTFRHRSGHTLWNAVCAVRLLYTCDPSGSAPLRSVRSTLWRDGKWHVAAHCPPRASVRAMLRTALTYSFRLL